MSSRKDAFIIVRIPTALKEKLQKVANKKDIKLSSLIRQVLEKV